MPNLNGLYGGKACNTSEGKELTKYAAEEDDEKKHYGTYEEIKKKGCCDLQICAVEDETITNVTGTDSCKGSCKSGWTQWSDWGKCEKDCGEERMRKRTRYFKNSKYK